MMTNMVILLHVAIRLVAMFAGVLQLQRHVDNALLLQLLPQGMLDLMPIPGGHHVHGGVVAVAVHAPDMDVVNVPAWRSASLRLLNASNVLTPSDTNFLFALSHLQ